MIDAGEGSLEAALRSFRGAAARSYQARVVADPRIRRPHLDVLREAFAELHSTAVGREAFRALLDDASPAVRAWVAAHLLAGGDLRGASVLRELGSRDDLVGLMARATLAARDRGTLVSPLEERRSA